MLDKGDLCQAFSGWEVVNVTTAPGVTELALHPLRRLAPQPVPERSRSTVPLIGGPTQTEVTLIKFNYDSAAGGSTSVTQLEWNGSTWVETPISPRLRSTPA